MSVRGRLYRDETLTLSNGLLHIDWGMSESDLTCVRYADDGVVGGVLWIFDIVIHRLF